MLGIPLGLITANATEWVVHKYVLHGWGRKKNSFWRFHLSEHHKNARKHDYVDPSYSRFPLGNHAQGKEAWALIAGCALVTPLMPVTPFYVGTLYYAAWNYYSKHKKSHQDPEWAKEHIPWHYDHHMGPNPNANWCITQPWFDHIMGTREVFYKKQPPNTVPTEVVIDKDSYIAKTT